MKIEHAPHNLPAQHTSGPQAQTRTTEETDSATPTDTVSISDQARGHAKALTAAGKNATSPAWQAREMMDQYEELRGQRFGKLVSAIARGEDPSAAYRGDPSADPETPEAGSATEITAEPADVETAATESTPTEPATMATSQPETLAVDLIVDAGQEDPDTTALRDSET